jgi:hypothetical protein
VIASLCVSLAMKTVLLRKSTSDAIVSLALNRQAEMGLALKVVADALLNCRSLPQISTG